MAGHALSQASLVHFDGETVFDTECPMHLFQIRFIINQIYNFFDEIFVREKILAKANLDRFKDSANIYYDNIEIPPL